ncbi:SDR family NAD(P)-dependent oxidoreductase [Micromonospora sp. NPDC048063]|uniref:SDR family NAD(P)-dependent oxidoreductase n=1 Tax=Micromonospora sp. NPDC048063 TaxID=3364256 RepID=UPI00371A853C
MDIAIVGMACAFPGASDAASFWANIVAGTDAVVEVDPGRWDADRYYSADDPRPGEKSPSRWGGFLAPVPFDPVAHGVPPAALGSIDPAQLLALVVAERALADAGYADRPFPRAQTSVIFGAEPGADLATAYGMRALLPTYFAEPPAALDAHLPRLTEDSFPGILGNVIAGRIANRLDLGGVNYTVDAACASSLAAVDLACKELAVGTSDMVLCGAVDVHNAVHDYLLFGSVQALSPTGRCRTFDESADGIVISEGVACLVLKRLADAERDGDRIHAVIAGVGGASDGRGMGLTAPRAQGQRHAVERALRAAGVAPGEIGLVEAHGTGTVVGDRTELSALSEVFAARGAGPATCSLGSVKSLIGHTKCAAGMAGLIKAVRAVQTGVRPPTGHLTRPNSYWDATASPFAFDGAARPWLTPPARRAAGVSAFGFGGTNFHAVVRAHPSTADPDQAWERWPAELFLLRAADEQSTGEAAQALSALAADAPPGDGALHALALEWFGRTRDDGRPVRAAVVAGSLDELRERLRLAAVGTADPGAGVYLADPGPAEPPVVALVFPGQGSQRPGMLADLFAAFPAMRTDLYDDPALAAVMFPPTSFDEATAAARAATLADTRHAQPALGVAELALLELLGSLGVRPDLLGGHSYGELVALHAAGALSRPDLLRLTAARAAAMHAAGGRGGAMAAVAASADEVAAALAGAGLDDAVVIANHNAPEQVVIAGPEAAVATAVTGLRARGRSATTLGVSCAFHSPAMADATEEFAAVLADCPVQPPQRPVWANASGQRYPDAPDEIRRILAGQLAAPVRFLTQVEDMYAAGARVFVEVGPGRVLSRMIGRILGDRPHRAVSCDVPNEPGLPRLLHALAELAVAGVPVDPARLFAGPRATSAPAPAATGWTVDGHLVRGPDGKPVPNGLRPADEAPRLAAADSAGSGDPRETAVLEFLRNSRELVDAQREIVLGYLDREPRPRRSAPDPTPVAAAASTEPARAEAADAGPTTVLGLAVDLLSERTGYPAQMLAPTIDLEADLGIDSIKRTELAETLLRRLAVPRPETRVSTLVGARTIADLVALLPPLDPAATGPATTPGDVPGPADTRTAGRATHDPETAGRSTPDAGTPIATVPGRAPDRYVPALQPLPAPSRAAADLSGRVAAVAGGAPDLADALRRRLARSGVSTADAATPPGELDLAILLPVTDAAGEPALPAAYDRLRALLTAGVPDITVVTTMGGHFAPVDSETAPAGQHAALAGIGFAGLVRTVAHEYPQTRVRLLDVDPQGGAEAVAERIVGEVAGGTPRGVVGLPDGSRVTRRYVRQELPAGSDALDLDPDSVVLVTGGGRGITARTAVALAERYGCHLEIVGRTAPPESAEDPATAGLTDPVELRRALLAAGTGTPAEVERRLRALLAGRELRAVLDRLEAHAASVRYHRFDIRDDARLAATVDEVYRRHGRIDVVVHGAGTLDDRLIRDKDQAAFTAVYDAKVRSARVLLDALKPDLRLLLFFSSVSGAFGNRGQADYAAANDALDTLALAAADRFTGRTLAVAWGPWAAAGGGMVSAELEREYARRGIAVIDPEAGVEALMREIAEGPRDAHQVLYVAGDPAPFQPAGFDD